MVGVVAHKILVSAPVPLVPYYALELGLTGLGMGLGGLGTKGLGQGIDKKILNFVDSCKKQTYRLKILQSIINNVDFVPPAVSCI